MLLTQIYSLNPIKNYLRQYSLTYIEIKQLMLEPTPIESMILIPFTLIILIMNP
jgi:hypothetical protein